MAAFFAPTADKRQVTQKIVYNPIAQELLS
jgi:hypothetical protein